MYSCHNTAVFIVVARAACGLQVPTLRRPQDGRKWSAGKFKDMSAHQREEAQNGGCSPESVLNYLEIWLRHPPHRPGRKYSIKGRQRFDFNFFLKYVKTGAWKCENRRMEVLIANLD